MFFGCFTTKLKYDQQALIFMKAVILCAGKSTRTYPLTVTRPKPMVMAGNKTLLELTLTQLAQLGTVNEVILVVGYRKEMLQEHALHLRAKLNLPFIISFAEQTEQNGTAHALLSAKDKLTEEFLLLHGDDLYFADDMKNLLQHNNAFLVKKVADPSQFGVCITNENNTLKHIHEKPTEFVGDLVNIGCYKLQPNILTLPNIQPSGRGELEIVDYLTAHAQQTPVMCVEAQTWIPIPFSWSLLEANKFLLSQLQPNNTGIIEHNVTLKGAVSIGKNTIIKAGTYIEGPVSIGDNAVIGPNAYIRGPTSIGNNCKIGASVEIKNCIIMNNSNVPHLSYMGDSILSENVNIGAGSITANVRHDEGTIKTMLKGQLVDTGLKKFGTVVGDNARIGINTCIYPGRKIWPSQGTVPGAQVTQDLNEDKT